ncbi:hypothetical protein Desca_1946 [Desulfotomaculum nigrificans CO-1-SRB]|uniref:Uncharacterized protein n=1 Tax=Desulfotomaculum nigrificans (strain DSM 14880 / VKM B-2319 / CO-1-SRB) TaxID=868595 RepID=F6B8U4_DESCC|nr:hypothetical protein [Desulfotomaculum nigrificans]AEF94787.1 hypothetical protein Desca_1946 [Desulfotomaculum nigrificans CO-1-SRB]
MKKISELLKYLKDPHAKEIQKLKDRYQELDELSNVAVEIGDVAAYTSLQSEMREVFFDYLTAVVVDSIYHLIPHVLILWLISLKWPIITIPVFHWQINIFVAYMLGYLGFYLVRFVTRSIKSKLLLKLV